MIVKWNGDEYIQFHDNRENVNFIIYKDAVMYNSYTTSEYFQNHDVEHVLISSDESYVKLGEIARNPKRIITYKFYNNKMMPLVYVMNDIGTLDFNTSSIDNNNFKDIKSIITKKMIEIHPEEFI